MRIAKLVRHTVLAACTCAAFICAPVGAIEILLLWDDQEPVSNLNSNTQALITALENAGFSVNLSVVTQANYDAAAEPPEDYDVVLHLNGAQGSPRVMSPGDANELVDYVENNSGGYVCSENNDRQIRLDALGAYTAITPLEFTNNLTPADLTITNVAPTHPVMQGIPNTFSYSSVTNSQLSMDLRTYGSQPGFELATDSDGNAAIAVRELGLGRIVMFNHRGNDQGTPPTISDVLLDTEAQQLYVNAVRWADKTPPNVESITTSTPFSNASEITWTVLFREAVVGVDVTDFTVLVDLSLTTGNLSVNQVSLKEYEVTVDGISGSGGLRLRLNDDDSIRDISDSLNLLVGDGVLDGTVTSSTVAIDSVVPNLLSAVTSSTLIQDGETIDLILEFDETMRTSTQPTVTLSTASNGAITATGGTWTSGFVYTVEVDRALTEADMGLATISVSGAQDFVGNVMAPTEVFVSLDIVNAIPVANLAGLLLLAGALAAATNRKRQ